VRRVLAAIGRVFVTAGILILLFVAYQLWGTGLYTDREQDRLRDEFTSEVQQQPSSSTTTTSAGGTPSTTTPTTSPKPLAVPQGDAVAQLRIPKLGVDSIVVNGVSREDLRKGPGHYPDTPLPGQEGDSAIAGHRTTYGAPFGDLDQLAPGDAIIVRTVQGTFSYRMTKQLVVEPTDISVLEPVHEDPADPSSPLVATLTLTTCNPKYSAAQRLVVQARLGGNQKAFPAPDLPSIQHLNEEGLSGEEGSKLPTLIAGIIAALIGALWWLMFHRHPRWTTWIIGAIPFAIALFVFYSFLERVLPANY
jgi:sortase A